MDIFLQTFCWAVAELTAAFSKNWVWFSSLSAIQTGVLASPPYECSFKPPNLAKVKRHFTLTNPESHSEN